MVKWEDVLLSFILLGLGWFLAVVAIIRGCVGIQKSKSFDNSDNKIKTDYRSISIIHMSVGILITLCCMIEGSTLALINSPWALNLLSDDFLREEYGFGILVIIFVFLIILHYAIDDLMGFIVSLSIFIGICLLVIGITGIKMNKIYNKQTQSKCGVLKYLYIASSIISGIVFILFHLF